ncbi:MAG: L,D-transpeptidase/peptidoglycan binding protein [bacterium]
MYHHVHHHIKISAILVIAITIFISFLMWGVDLVFAHKVGLGVQVSGINLTGKTELETKQTLEQKFWQVSQTGVNLTFQDERFHPALDQIGVTLNTSDLAKQAINFNRGGNFISRFWQTSKILFFGRNIKITSEVDLAKLHSYLEHIGKDNIQRAQNATLIYSDKNSNSYFEIVQEEVGKIIDIDSASDKINDQIQHKTDITNQELSTIELQATSNKPTIICDDLSSIKEEANRLISKSFVFNYGNLKFTAEPSDIAKWLDFIEVNRETQIEIDELALNKYLDIIAEKIDIPVIDTIIELTGTKKTTKREGREGRQLNRTLVIQTINEIFFENSDRGITLETNTIKPAEKIVYPDSPPIGGLYPGRYIELNISAKQKMYLWEGKKLIATYTISSGKPGYYTPTGTYHVMSKNIRAWSSKYGLYMPYWMAFTSAGHGIHELPEWPGGYKEGLNHLGLRVSHGCVRLGVGPAAYLYSWASIGTPIYIHY